nr:ribonuclease H-like domain-containing protein [Tanacetum cinerariifolium]
MLAIPDEHLLMFYACKDANSLWEAFKNRFQNLISQIEFHGEVISQEDVNLKLLRSLPSAWSNIALIMRHKSDLDTLSIDDLYNNLKVYESEIKGQLSSRSNSHNVAFVSSDNTNSTNETVNTTHSVFAASGYDWSFQVKEGLIKFALMAHSSSSSSSDSETSAGTKLLLGCGTLTELPRVFNFDFIFNSYIPGINKFTLFKTRRLCVAFPSDKQHMYGHFKKVKALTRHMTRNKSYLTDYQEIDGGFVAFKGNAKGVNAAKQSSYRAAALVSNAKRVNTVATRPNVNDALPTTYSYCKTHSPIIKKLMVDLLHLKEMLKE